MVSLSAELDTPPGSIRIADIGAAFLGNKPPVRRSSMQGSRNASPSSRTRRASKSCAGA